MHLWRIVQKGGRLRRARINSRDDVCCQTLEILLSIQEQTLIWLTFNYRTTWRSTTRWTRTFEGRRGARMFHLVSLSLQFSLTVCLALALACVCVGCCCCLFGWVGFWFLSLGKFVLNHKLTPVVDRPSLALVRQCRKKNTQCGSEAYVTCSCFRLVVR